MHGEKPTATSHRSGIITPMQWSWTGTFASGFTASLGSHRAHTRRGPLKRCLPDGPSQSPVGDAFRRSSRAATVSALSRVSLLLPIGDGDPSDG
ncbi:hypothetical protein IscW_ISCW023106 [Ixodes scapularis]|uniref:Uncharacterized protein n=1 Tax=Ixodes scapularis TaxID=6945 RepID=B7QLP4_IXOSC|nr:hypothetical protein IscW_ISCW023106 [Ixodes scapularis]|eukprot:XP_002416099.1 hypothetical protein IscW_ISCW023106 [Ixodes scapularis]